MSHTPGPWRAVFTDDPRGQPVVYYSGLVCVIAEGDQRISVVADRDCTAQEWADNARLIAEAPSAVRIARYVADEATVERVARELEPLWRLHDLYEGAVSNSVRHKLDVSLSTAGAILTLIATGGAAAEERSPTPPDVAELVAEARIATKALRATQNKDSEP